VWKDKEKRKIRVHSKRRRHKSLGMTTNQPHPEIVVKRNKPTCA